MKILEIDYRHVRAAFESPPKSKDDDRDWQVYLRGRDYSGTLVHRVTKNFAKRLTLAWNAFQGMSLDDLESLAILMGKYRKPPILKCQWSHDCYVAEDIKKRITPEVVETFTPVKIGKITREQIEVHPICIVCGKLNPEYSFNIASNFPVYYCETCYEHMPELFRDNFPQEAGKPLDLATILTQYPLLKWNKLLKEGFTIERNGSELLIKTPFTHSYHGKFVFYLYPQAEGKDYVLTDKGETLERKKKAHDATKETLRSVYGESLKSFYEFAEDNDIGQLAFEWGITFSTKGELVKLITPSDDDLVDQIFIFTQAVTIIRGVYIRAILKEEKQLRENTNKWKASSSAIMDDVEIEDLDS